MRRLPSFAIALSTLLAAACGSSDLPVDAGLDAPSPEDAAPSDAPVGEPDGGCDVGVPPSPLPDVVGGFAVDGADGGSAVPAPSGGDPIGLWVFERATFYVAPAAAEMFDESSSTVDGTAWLEVTATEFALDWRFVTTLMGTMVGTIVRPSSTQIRATYTLDAAGSTFVPDPICAQSSAAMATTDGGAPSTSMLSFSQSGDAITVISRLGGAAGDITIVLEGTRRTR